MASATSNADLKRAIAEFLRGKNVHPQAAWLGSFLTSVRPNTPILALQQTALFRILASDLTLSTQPTPPHVWPVDVSNPQIKERKVAGPVTVQVLDAEDIAHSRWSQVEDLEAQERGEMTKGREVIRLVPEDPNDVEQATQSAPAISKSGPHRLLLQDAAGTKCYAFDMAPLPTVNLQHLALGAKLVLREVAIARGVALLEPRNVEVLGGKVEAWDKKWKSERKEVLKRKADLGISVG